MASSAYVEAFFGGLDAAVRRALKSAFDYVLADIRFGRAAAGERAANLGGAFLTGTTPSTANTEFAVPHSFGRAPYLAVPVLPLDAEGAAIPRLQVARPASASHIYLKSPDTSIPVTLYVEG